MALGINALFRTKAYLLNMLRNAEEYQKNGNNFPGLEVRPSEDFVEGGILAIKEMITILEKEIKL